jgi:hypothetical protein
MVGSQIAQDSFFVNTSYTLARIKSFTAVLHLLLWFIFALCERESEPQTKWQVPCCRRLEGVLKVTQFSAAINTIYEGIT